MDIGTGDIEFDDAGQLFLIEQTGTFTVFLYGEAGHIGQDFPLIDFSEFRQDLFHDFMDTGVLQTDCVQHAGR